MAEPVESATEYMTRHLSHQQAVVGHWTFNVDTLVTSTLLAVIIAALFYIAARRARPDRPPTGLTLFAEQIYDFVDENVSEAFQGEQRFIVALSLALFTWVVSMNGMDLLPADLPDKVAGLFGAHGWHVLPTADINNTFAMAVVVALIVMIAGIRGKGLVGFLQEWIWHPLGKNPALWIPNIILNLLELLARPISLALRLFGNMFAGELLFLLIALFTLHGLNSVSGGVLFFFQVLFGFIWGAFDVLVALLQGYIFMLLPIVYIAMAGEHHE